MEKILWHHINLERKLFICLCIDYSPSYWILCWGGQKPHNTLGFAYPYLICPHSYPYHIHILSVPKTYSQRECISSLNKVRDFDFALLIVCLHCTLSCSKTFVLVASISSLYRLFSNPLLWSKIHAVLNLLINMDIKWQAKCHQPKKASLELQDCIEAQGYHFFHCNINQVHKKSRKFVEQRKQMATGIE